MAEALGRSIEDTEAILAATAARHARVKAWLDRHPRVHFHFVPTSASWLNLVERFFSELTQRQLKRLAVHSVGQLVHAITTYIDDRNRAPKPFVWTATVQDAPALPRGVERITHQRVPRPSRSPPGISARHLG